MIKYKLQYKDSTIVYKGSSISIKNFNLNEFTGIWTFDLYYPNGRLLGVPISTGTNIVKGNGTPFYGLVFLDSVSNSGDVTAPANTSLYILEE